MINYYGDNGLICSELEDDDYDPPAWENTNCRNCGAPLVRGQIKCEYCGTSRQIKSELIMNASSIRLVCY